MGKEERTVFPTGMFVAALYSLRTVALIASRPNEAGRRTVFAVPYFYIKHLRNTFINYHKS